MSQSCMIPAEVVFYVNLHYCIVTHHKYIQVKNAMQCHPLALNTCLMSDDDPRCLITELWILNQQSSRTAVELESEFNANDFNIEFTINHRIFGKSYE